MATPKNTSAPGAISGKVPVTAKPATPAPKTSSTKNSEVTKIATGITSDLGKLAGLLGQYYTQTTAAPTAAPVTPAAPSNATNDALMQALLAGQQTAAANAAAQAQGERQSAYDILMSEFSRYGLGALVEPLKGFIISGSSPSELTIQLQNTEAYKKRFAANADRISKGLAALSPAEYIAMEDQYQNIMRNYGLPETYYAKDAMGTQAGFQQLLANDVSATELEDRVLTAQNRVTNANPEVYKALKAFYPDITNGDILAYTLDPSKALDAIKRKVTAAEIGGAALAAGLTTEAATAENLARYGVTKQQAEQGYQTIGGMLPRAAQLADIYQQDAYTQAVAEAEVFGTGGAVGAANKRKKLTALEQAAFAGSSGAAQNALSRDRASSVGMYRESGAGSF